MNNSFASVPGAVWLPSWTPRPRTLAGLLAAAAIAVPVAPQDMLPTAAAASDHTVTYQITGAGDAFSIIPDPGTPVYPANTNTWVPLPWSQTVKASGGTYVSLNWTDHSGTHDCVIQVDGKAVALTEHSPGRCAYQIPS